MESAEPHLLIVEDAPEYCARIQDSLCGTYQLTFCSTAADARRLSASKRPDLAIVDIGLPDDDGFVLGKEIAESTPVIFLTGRGSTDDKVRGLSSGAVDYMTKPFDGRELHARVEAHLRRARNQAPDPFLFIGPFRVSFISEKIFRIADGEETDIQLTPFEFRLFKFLHSRAGTPVSREDILAHVWDGVYVRERTVDKHLSSLRAKLGKEASWIRSVHNFGYVFNPS